MRTYPVAASCIICMLLAFQSYAQKKGDSIYSNHQTIELDLTDSGGISIINNDRKQNQYKRGLFEISSHKPVKFRIININPLRHNYFLNDQLVTNFIDATSSVVSNNIGLNTINTIKEIAAINIFNFETTPETNQEEKLMVRDLKKELDRLRTEYHTISDSLFRKNLEILNLPKYNDFYEGKKIPDLELKTINSKLDQYDIISKKLEGIEKDMYNTFNDIQNYLNNSSTKDISVLLKRCMSRDTSEDPEMKNTIKEIESQCVNLKGQQEKINSLIVLLGQINTQRLSASDFYNKGKRANLDANLHQNRETNFLTLLQEVGYLDGRIRIIQENQTSSNQFNMELNEEKLKIYEYIFERRTKLIETCILNNSLEVGKLLEKKWLQYSRDRNEYLNKSSITKNDINSVKKKKEDITLFFNYVKEWIADFALLSQSVKLDNKVFKGLHQNITENCLKFLALLRDLDHLTEPNITEYTSPIYHNQKNIDMIRFKVDKQDKLSSSRQTYEYDMWIRGGWKIDFSVGFLASGLVDWQYNKTPYYTNDSTVVSTDSFFISKSDIGRFNFCFGGMVNLIPRNGARWMNMGISLGVAYSTNQKLQALTGLSFHLGKTERIILHGGFAFGTIKELDEQQLTRLDFGKIPERAIMVKGNLNEFTVPTVERFSVKPFFGISYNLTGQNAFQAVKSQGGVQYYNSELSR